MSDLRLHPEGTDLEELFEPVDAHFVEVVIDPAHIDKTMAPECLAMFEAVDDPSAVDGDGKRVKNLGTLYFRESIEKVDLSLLVHELCHVACHFVHFYTNHDAVAKNHPSDYDQYMYLQEAQAVSIENMFAQVLAQRWVINEEATA